MSRPPELDDPEWLRRRYVDEQRSTYHIASELLCSQKTVYRALHRLGIPVRAQAESMRTPTARRHLSAARRTRSS